MDRTELKEIDRFYRQSLGRFFIDLSKLVFTGVVVGGVVQLVNANNVLIVVFIVLFGLFMSCVLAMIGFKILR